MLPPRLNSAFIMLHSALQTGVAERLRPFDNLSVAVTIIVSHICEMNGNKFYLCRVK